MVYHGNPIVDIQALEHKYKSQLYVGYAIVNHSNHCITGIYTYVKFPVPFTKECHPPVRNSYFQTPPPYINDVWDRRIPCGISVGVHEGNWL